MLDASETLSFPAVLWHCEEEPLHVLLTRMYTHCLMWSISKRSLCFPYPHLTKRSNRATWKICPQPRLQRLKEPAVMPGVLVRIHFSVCFNQILRTFSMIGRALRHLNSPQILGHRDDQFRETEVAVHRREHLLKSEQVSHSLALSVIQNRFLPCRSS